jgi:hypothetical protein
MLLAFAMQTLAINHRILFSFSTFTNSMRWHGATPMLGHAGLQLDWPSTYYPYVVHALTGVVIDGLALAAVAIVIARQRRSSDVVPVALAILCFAPLLACRSNFPRYALPAVVFVTLLAALAVAWVRTSIPSRWRRAWTVAAIALVMTLQLRVCLRHIERFGDDSRDRLVAWMAGHLPAGSRVAADTYAGPFVTFGGQQAISIKPGVRVHAALSAADIGTIDELRATGYTHVAVSAAAYARYFDPHLHPFPESASDYSRRRHWYARLFNDQELMWSSDPSPDMFAYTDPPLRLYKLRVSSPAESAAVAR